jgi:hypothetical protein
LEQHFSRHPLARFDKEQKTVVRIWIAKTVNARNARHDDYIASFEQSASCGHSKTIDLLVNNRLLFDVDICGRNVSLWLIVVVIRHEILDGIFGEKGAKLLVELSGECFVVCKHKR